MCEENQHQNEIQPQVTRAEKTHKRAASMIVFSLCSIPRNQPEKILNYNIYSQATAPKCIKPEMKKKERGTKSC